MVLLGEVTIRGARVAVEIEPVQLDRRQIAQMEIEVSGVTHRGAYLEHVEHALQASGCGEEDLVLAEVRGRLPRGIHPSIPPEFLADRYFHVEFDTSGVKPDYDLDVYLRSPPSSTEGRFVREMKDRIDEETDRDRRKILENALYYGLDALVQKEVSPRYED